MKECKHDWCYSSWILTTNPPQYPKICRKCGKQEIEVGYSYLTNEYDELIKKFKEK